MIRGLLLGTLLATLAFLLSADLVSADQNVMSESEIMATLGHATSVAGVLTPSYFQFSEDLFYGVTSPEVVELQRYLNTNGFAVATDGPGSPGQETDFFGELTQKALVRFQMVHNVMPAAGYFGTLTRNRIKPASW